MSADLRTLRRVLRQLADAGCRDVLLAGLTGEEALRLVRAARERERARSGEASALATGSVRPPGAAPADATAVALPPAAASAPAASSPAARIRETLAAAGIQPGAGAPAAPRRPRTQATTASPPPAGGVAATEADAALAALSGMCGACTACRLHEGRRHVVFGEGTAGAAVVVVGEAPGQEEDRTGRPFVGRAGRLLDLLLMTAGFARESVYICNVLKCRPPQNRNPLPDEVAQCTTLFLHPQLDAIAPKVLIAVGKFAAQALLETEESIGRLRNRVHAYRGTPLVVTYHPAFLLRSPQMCRVAWHDFQLLRRIHDEQG
jgi:uracil-DNA glycosylase